MGLSFRHRGSFDNIESFLESMENLDIVKVLDPYGQSGVAALAEFTPENSGIAADSWDYRIESDGDNVKIIWLNYNVEGGFPVVIMLQYGYATGTGGYVEGRDFINPAIASIFEDISDGVWKVVTSA